MRKLSEVFLTTKCKQSFDEPKVIINGEKHYCAYYLIIKERDMLFDDPHTGSEPIKKEQVDLKVRVNRVSQVLDKMGIAHQREQICMVEYQKLVNINNLLMLTNCLLKINFKQIGCLLKELGL